MPNCFNICEVAYYVFNVCAVANDAERSAASRRDAGARQYCKRVVAREAAVAALGGGEAGPVPSCQERRTAARCEACFFAANTRGRCRQNGQHQAAGKRSYPVAKQRACAICKRHFVAAAAMLIITHPIGHVTSVTKSY